MENATGHGLSGSLMTMLGISLLNEIVSKPENQNLQTCEILNLLRTSIVDSLHQTGDIGEIHDGIDIVFGIYDKANLQIQFAAAYNPLYHVSINEQMDPILNDYKGDPMPVGIYEKANGFTNHVLPVKKGDIIYIFSDGFPDQFGGTQGKKLRAKNFKQLLVSLYNYPLESQKELIGGFFDDWRGSHEQTDDVMVIGFKI
jgi:serine phosphatase RsbU (regulator of sigma subunit)